MAESTQSREARYWIYAVAVVAAAAAGGLVLALRLESGSQLRLEIQKSVLTLIAGGLIGGVLKILLDDVIASRKRWDEAASFVTAVLGDLKAVYDRIERARLLIPAHQSAKTYGEELRDLIDSRVKLLNVLRALRKRTDGLHEATRGALEADVARMECFIGGLTAEFRDRYKNISNAQSVYEAAVKKALDHNEVGAVSFPDVPNTPWEMILALPAAKPFLDGDPRTYRSEFVAPLDHASAILRAELARILRRGRISTESLRDVAPLERPPSELGHRAADVDREPIDREAVRT